MGEEEAERTVIKCQGQVVNVRLPRVNEDPDQGGISTIALSTPEVSQLGYLYLRQPQDYSLGFVFEIEITLHRIPSDKFFDKRGLKRMPITNGANPI